MMEGCSIGSNEEKLVTIIVPVYNMQNYLRECLTSIAGQSYRNLEVILVNDGSTDASGDICEYFCKRDSRFHLVVQDNAGLGAARNAGIRNAKGNYICFIDSDDYVHPDYVALLYENLIRCQADISICGYMTFQDDDTGDALKMSVSEITNEVELVRRVDLIKALSGSPYERIRTAVAWNKLVSREWLGDFHFVHKLHEDEFMINEFIMKCRSAVVSSAKLYYYRQRSGSIMNDRAQISFRHLDRLEALEQRIRYFQSDEYKEVQGILLVQYLKDCRYWYGMLADGENNRILKKRILPSYRNYFISYFWSGFPDCRKLRGIRGFLLFAIWPDLYVWCKKGPRAGRVR